MKKKFKSLMPLLKENCCVDRQEKGYFMKNIARQRQVTRADPGAAVVTDHQMIDSWTLRPPGNNNPMITINSGDPS